MINWAAVKEVCREIRDKYDEEIGMILLILWFSVTVFTFFIAIVINNFIPLVLAVIVPTIGFFIYWILLACWYLKQRYDFYNKMMK